MLCSRHGFGSSVGKGDGNKKLSCVSYFEHSLPCTLRLEALSGANSRHIAPTQKLSNGCGKCSLKAFLYDQLLHRYQNVFE